MQSSKTQRAFEVEVRAHIREEYFAEVLAKLTEQLGEPKVTDMKTFLFRGTSGNGRIRISKDDSYGVLTEKNGSYEDKAREEIEKEFDLGDTDIALTELSDRGLNECSYLRSTSYTFSATGTQKIFLAKHGHLGNFLEVEMIVENESEIAKAHVAVSRTLAELGFEELPAETYQHMMDEIYTKTLRPVSEYKSEITVF